jgi:glutamate/tyrosine decarboxylase-like PLP-dependent enzyme
MTTTASYLISADRTDPDAARDQIDWNPEWSRRGRGLLVYSAIRSLGRAGIETMIERCCDHVARLVHRIGQLAGSEVLVEPSINQGHVRLLCPGGDHNRSHR